MQTIPLVLWQLLPSMIPFCINLGRAGSADDLALDAPNRTVDFFAPLQSLPHIRNVALLSTQFCCSSQNQGGVMTFPLFLPSHFHTHQQALLEQVLCFQHRYLRRATITSQWTAGLLFHPQTILHLAARLCLSMINLTLLKPFSWLPIPFGMKFTFLLMVLNVLCHLPPAFLSDPIVHTSLLINAFQTLSLLPFLAKSAPPQSYYIHFSCGLEGPFPKSLHSWLLLLIYLAPQQASRQRDLHWSLQLETLPPPIVTLYQMTMPTSSSSFFFFSGFSTIWK